MKTKRALDVEIVSRNRQELAKEAIAASLYAPRGTLFESLFDVSRYSSYAKKEIVVCARHNGVCVGVCHVDRFHNISIYVKPSCRRRGVGTRLVSKAKTLFRKNPLLLTSYLGHRGQESNNFWNKQQILNITHATSLTLQEANDLISRRRPHAEIILEVRRRSFAQVFNSAAQT